MKGFSVVAPLAGADGYGQSAEQLILAARGQGEDVEFVSHDWRDERFSDEGLVASESPQVTRDVTVVHFLPFAFSRFRGRKTTIGSTMFETDSIPPFWVPCCNATDGLLVPSEHCRRAFQPHVQVPVKVTPYGVDTGFYNAISRPFHRPTFTFLMTGLLHYRKGAEFAVRAFREEFPDEANVRLLLKTRRGFLDTGGEEFRGDDVRIRALHGDFTRQQMRELYFAADCFLAPSRGEASGLTPREAMSTGLPTIVTDWGGLQELADPRYAWPLEVECLEPAPPSCSSYDANVAGHEPIGNFARPSVGHLRRLMREVYSDRRAAYRRGMEGARWMRRDWTWSVCARRWLAAIESLSA